MERPDRGEMMKEIEQKAYVQGVKVQPRTLIIRPMEYKHPIGVSVFFSGVFGCDSDSKGENDIWVGTFFDRNEAETFILASKSFGQIVLGVRLTKQETATQQTVEVADVSRVRDRETSEGQG